MAEASVSATAADEAGTRTTSTGSRRSQRDYRRRRQQRHCSTLTTASVGTTDDTYHDTVGDHSVAGIANEEPNDRVLRRRGAVRERRRRYMDVDGTVNLPVPRHPLFEDNLMMGEAMMLDRIDGLNDAWDAGRLVAVLRQRRDMLFGVTEQDLINALIGEDGFGGVLGADRVDHVFPIGESRFTECFICTEFKNLHLRACCSLAACDDCLRNYLSMQVGQAFIKIQCIGADCNALMHRDEILARLSGADKSRYVQFLIDANCDPLRRTCPRCSHVLAIDAGVLSSADKYGLMVTCTECQLDWCFPCHAPWHAHMKCSEFLRGDKMLKAWAREQHYGQVNAQKCPKCKFYIQRSSGCDHMTCSRCKTDFCYRCGDRFRELKFVGNHYSKLSIFGCKYRFKPTQPVQRKLIRGSIFAAQLMAVPALGALALGAGAVVASVGSLVLPFYAGYKLHKRLERRRSAKRRRRAREAMWHRLEDMRWRGEELDISHPMLTELDTSQIIRSYIGVELASTDGNLSTSSDTASHLDSIYNVSSATDEDDDIDDISLHIRDEACQTGDDEAENPTTGNPQLIGYYPIIRDQAKRLGAMGPADEEISVWRTLLHNDEVCSEAENDINSSIKYSINPTCAKQGDHDARSFHHMSDDDDDGITSILISSDVELPVCRACGEVGGVCREVGGACGRGGILCEFPHRRLFRSDSGPLAFTASDTAVALPKMRRSSSVPSVFKKSLPDSSKEMEGDKKCSMEVGSSPLLPGEEMAAAATPVLEVNNPSSMLMSRHLKPSDRSSSCWEGMADPPVSESDITVTIHAELPGDTTETSTPDVHLPFSTVDAREPRPESLSGNPHGFHFPGVTCMDHQACSLLADFVAHL